MLTGASRIILVDDHGLFRECLRSVLELESDLEVVGEAGDAREASQIVEKVEFDLALVDFALPGANGISVIHELHRLRPEGKVLVLSAYEDSRRVAEALRAGASGFALKSQSIADIVAAIRSVLGGARYLAPRIARGEVEAMLRAEATEPLDQLSRRELEIFDLLVRGHSNDAIAAELFIAPRTVETHRQHIMTKSGVHSIVDLVRLAAQTGRLAD